MKLVFHTYRIILASTTTTNHLLLPVLAILNFLEKNSVRGVAPSQRIHVSTPKHD